MMMKSIQFILFNLIQLTELILAVHGDLDIQITRILLGLLDSNRARDDVIELDGEGFLHVEDGLLPMCHRGVGRS